MDPLEMLRISSEWPKNTPNIPDKKRKKKKGKACQHFAASKSPK